MSENDRVENTKRAGFDAPAKTRQEDHLNRWPFAREIYTAAVSGPKDWSVRIGVYGEWGTGKTSVLEFIASMAVEHNHVVVWFDPWEYSSREVLWREFVLKIFKSIEARIGGTNEGATARRKAFFNKVAGVVKAMAASAVKAINEKAGDITDSGLNLLKTNFGFGSEDLEDLREVLGDRRVIVLIDDLDRTAAELVPEILFALKELMDIPGFSFVCAFDPLVVGQVLGRGDGLKFLEKIIDYPRWLPATNLEGLTHLALEERKAHCPFVPEVPLGDAISLLPPNPRAVRQFIRLLSLLRPQVDRHHDHELKWPIILAANVLKIRYPHLADPLLGNRAFWNKWVAAAYGFETHGKKEDESAALIKSHVEEVTKSEAADLSAKEKKELLAALEKLCSVGGSGFLLLDERISYQFRIAESPAAVTAKEFDSFLELWRDEQKKGTVTRHSSPW